MEKRNTTKRIFTVMILLVFVCSLFDICAYPVGSGIQGDKTSVKIWVDRGCGGRYDPGDVITIYFNVVSSEPAALVTIFWRTPDKRTNHVEYKRMYSTHEEHSLSSTIMCPEGRHTLEIFAQPIPGTQDEDVPEEPPQVLLMIDPRDSEVSDQCFFYVEPPCRAPDTDKDKDGFSPPNDCDDTNSHIHPGAAEKCDQKDNDCDGQTDEGCYVCVIDNDNDGFTTCHDCNDYDPSVHPGAAEVCDQKDNDCDGQVDEKCVTCSADGDQDGYTSCEDCNDYDNSVYPGAGEVCDGKDNNCDGFIDEGCPVCFTDSDGDGFSACTDCNDANPYVYPGAPELCDRKDNDCDGQADEGLDCGYVDIWVGKGCGAHYSDGDSVGIYFKVTASAPSAEVTVAHYPPKDGTRILVSDRVYETHTVHRLTTTATCLEGLEILIIVVEVVVEGRTVVLFDYCSFYVGDCRARDNDGDGYISIPHGGDDCNDFDPDIHPGAVEECDQKDNDCNQLIDEGGDCEYVEIWVDKKCGAYYDDEEYMEVYFGVWSSSSSADVTIIHFPGGGEPKTLVSDRTFGTNEEYHFPVVAVCPKGLQTLVITATVVIGGRTVVLTDNCLFYVTDCRLPDTDGDGYVSVPKGGEDCDDDDPHVHPGGEERCDKKDNDCDGKVDEGFDTDGDGYSACEGDCDDTDSDVHPGAEEVCDTKDNDCDGLVDETADKDNDGYGAIDCGGNDCDDTDPDVHPGAAEQCDKRDNDCDGNIDEGFDNDHDGHKSVGCGGDDCDDTDPDVHPGAAEQCDGKDNDCDGLTDEDFDKDHDGYTSCRGDCDDADPDVYPKAEEVCDDDIDNDCDGEVDETADKDNDWYKSLECGGNDCDDSDSSTHPGAKEQCDHKDNDCDGQIDEGLDKDGDGFKPCDGDCNDDDPDERPGAIEICDQKDNNCNGLIDEGFDNDNDGYTACGGDCNDTDSNIYPGAEEVQDNIDNDCDGEIDEEDTEKVGSVIVSVRSRCGNPVYQAGIYLDGNFKGETNIRGELIIPQATPGDHTVTAKKETYEEDSQSINVSHENIENVLLVLRSEDNPVCFSGFEWHLRDTKGERKGPPESPGNCFSSDNIEIDEETGYLHLFIKPQEGEWQCAEIYTKEPLWFGTYTFYVIGRLDQLDKNVVFGMFNYWDWKHQGTHEIDIEFSTWLKEKECPWWWPLGWPFCTEPENSQFVVWPVHNYQEGNEVTEPFNTNLNGTWTTHTFDWQKEFIAFQSLHGHENPPPSRDYVIYEWYYTENGGEEPYIPQRPLWVHINLWLVDGTNPYNDIEVKVTIKGFEFTESQPGGSVHVNRSHFSSPQESFKKKLNLFSLILLNSSRWFATILKYLILILNFPVSF
jgi:hypothetical protein